MSLNKPIKPVKIMEICGTHTMSIAQNGIRSLLPEDIELISGPGCPVCVSPSSVIDIALDLIQDPNVFLFSYGDMLRIPSTDQKHLLGNKNVKMCLTPMDALNFAKKYPDKKIIFLGVGFETTAPGSAVAILEASRQNIQNFFFWSLLKQTKPAIKTLIEAKGSSIDGFICPGHVACIIGEKGFTFLCDEYNKPGVITGFEPEDILYSIDLLIDMINQKQPQIKNTYKRAVKYEGNINAIQLIQEVFQSDDSIWRGLGSINNSGFTIKEKYAQFDAIKQFDLPLLENKEPQNCQCANILCGKKKPFECPLFKKICTPSNPIGPCMVSSEGACAASYMYD